MKFKIGDEVRIVSNYYADGKRGTQSMVGKIGTIVKAVDSPHERYPYGVKVGDRIYGYMLEESFELIKEKNVSEIKVGDKVIVKSGLKGGQYTDDGLYISSGMAKLAGKEFTVKSVISNNRFRVEGYNAWTWNEGLVETLKFKVGDVVKSDSFWGEDFYRILAATEYGYITTEAQDTYEKALEEDEVDAEIITKKAESDFTVIKKPKIKEVTLSDVAAKFNINVESLRIKE